MRAVGSAIASGAERTGSWLGSGGWTSSAEGQGDAGWTGGVALRQAWGMGSGWQDWGLRKPGGLRAKGTQEREVKREGDRVFQHGGLLMSGMILAVRNRVCWSFPLSIERNLFRE